MSKTTEQIAEDCGMLAPEAKMLARVRNQVGGSVEPYPNMLEEIVGALYRRIEKLEELKSELLGYVRESSSADNCNCASVHSWYGPGHCTACPCADGAHLLTLMEGA